jgi:hypothetical protein
VQRFAVQNKNFEPRMDANSREESTNKGVPGGSIDATGIECPRQQEQESERHRFVELPRMQFLPDITVNAVLNRADRTVQPKRIH